MNRRFLKTICAVFISTLALDAAAVGTRRFVLDNSKAFEGGELEGVAIASDGSIRAGWTLANTPLPDATSVWSAVTLGDGSVLLGTGAGGRIYQVKNGKVSIAAETGEMAVSALVIGYDGDVIAGTFPTAKLFRLPVGKLDGSKLTAWSEIKDTEDIWALAFDPKGKSLLAATGPEGKLFRVDGSGKSEVFFDSEDAHLVSVAFGPDGSVYAGSSGKGLLYKLTGPGRATVLYDFDAEDVRAITFGPAAKGSLLHVITNKYDGQMRGLSPQASAGMGAGPVTTRPSRPGKGQLWRFDAKGAAELMMKNDETHFVTLEVDADGVPYVGSGAEGRVYAVDDNHVERLLVDTDERQVGAMSIAGKNRFVVTSDPVVFHAITGSGGPDAVWTSKVLDAALRAQWGKLDFQGDGTLELETRSGNTDKPDDTWSGWSGAQSKPDKIKSPAARYLQIRARWAKDAAAVLREIQVAFVTDNARALITDVTVGDSHSDTGSDRVPESGSPPGDPSTKVSIKWSVDNPDSDKMLYRLFYRREGDKAWFSMQPADEELTTTSYTWDTSGLPEGRYRVRVDASDELANPPDRVTRHTLESRVAIVDNTAPSLTALTLTGNKLVGTAVDEVGPIARLEFALVGKKSWYPIFPKDGIFDDATESFEVDVSGLVPDGPHLVVVRAYDANGNRVERAVSRGK
jgi:hypothetical protein